MTTAEIARLLLQARQDGGRVHIDVADTAQAYAVQALVMAELGPVGGWKVGAAGPDAPPNCAPMPASVVSPAPHTYPPEYTQREVESEICFVFGADLKPRATPYQPADILAAIATCHPGIEVLQSRLIDPDSAGALAVLADAIQHGAYAVGAPIANWRDLDFATMQITQTIEGGPTKQGTGNPAGDMIRLMVWLANEGAVWAGGIAAGQVVTCGSWTGKITAPGGSQVAASFSGAEPVQISFAPVG